MKRFLVYDKETKQVLREGQCPDNAFTVQAQRENEAVCDPATVLKRVYVEPFPAEEPQ